MYVYTSCRTHPVEVYVLCSNSWHFPSHTAGPWLKRRPEFALLQLIKYTDASGKERTYYFIQEIQNSCRELGTPLGIDRATIEGLESRSRSVKEFCEKVLEKWLERDEKATWYGLLQALKDAQLAGAPYNNLKKALTFHFK